MRKDVEVVLIALLACVILTMFGCKKKEEVQPTEIEQPSEPQAVATQQVSGDVTIFSWWTAGGEAEGLQALIDEFKSKYPQVNVINAAVAGGAGTNAKAVLKTRMMGGNPPDSFQVHGGSELIDTWVKPNMMEPITDIYNEEGWLDKFPKGLIDMVSYNNEIYAVPSNIHRGNVLWYNKAIFEANGLVPPTTFDEFFAVCEKLKAKGIIPLSIGTREKWPITHLFEAILLGVGGPDFYRELFYGKIPWTDERVKQSLEILAKMMKYVNSDHAALTWDQACALVLNGKAAMNIMGDWAKGYFVANGWVADKDFGAVPSPGTSGSFIVVTDTFGLPKGAKNPVATKAFLKVVGSVSGQVAFNLKKGSIPARIDVPTDAFDPIAKQTISDFATNSLVPSCAHGSATLELFVTSLNDELSIFIQKLDATLTMNALEAAAKDAGIRQ